jgi:putative membrane protein
LVRSVKNPRGERCGRRFFWFLMAARTGEDLMDGQMSAWGWAMMIVFSTLWAALLVAAIWALYNYGIRSRPGRRRAPEELLADRYARGDITTDEYQERLDTLQG